MISAWRTTAGCAALFMAAQAPAADFNYGPRLIHLSVVDRESGGEKPIYLHQRRYFVAGGTGQRYALRIQNVSAERVLAVLSVDGVNIISGETAASNQSGYVLNPYQTTEINGWRKNTSEIAAFRFAALPNSYAARTGRPDNVGVIGLAVFTERQPEPAFVAPPAPSPAAGGSVRRSAPSAGYPPPPPPPPAPAPAPPALDSDRSARATMAAPPAAKLGTAHGEIETSYSSQTAFDRATASPVSVRVIEYDSEARLIALGIIPRHRPASHPQPFPAERGAPGFVPDPPA